MAAPVRATSDAFLSHHAQPAHDGCRSDQSIHDGQGSPADSGACEETPPLEGHGFVYGDDSVAPFGAELFCPAPQPRLLLPACSRSTPFSVSPSARLLT